MKNLVFFALLAITASVSTNVPSGEEWILESSGFKAKEGARVEITADPKFAMSATLNDTHLILDFSDGKRKFGVSAIEIQSGENVFLLPRLKLSVPIEDVKNVKSGTPLLVSSFSVRGDSFKARLVHSGGDIPNVVITKQVVAKKEASPDGADAE